MVGAFGAIVGLWWVHVGCISVFSLRHVWMHLGACDATSCQFTVHVCCSAGAILGPYVVMLVLCKLRDGYTLSPWWGHCGCSVVQV